jgi:hypothetical protein
MSLGSVATTTVDALKQSPLLLVVIILNAGMIWALLFVASSQRDERQMLTKMLIENCQPKSPG